MISITAGDHRPAQPLISIVVACYNEEASLRVLHDALSGAFGPRADLRCEFVLVDDGSRDRTAELLAELAAHDRRVTVVTLSRNFGQQAALSAGLQQARGDAVILCDADLQDRPETMLRMIEHWRNGADVVYGVRRRRKESGIMRAVYYGFYRLLRSLADTEIPADSGDFGLMDRKVVDAINALPERNRFLRGLRAWVGYTQVPLVYERDARVAGKPKYSLRKLTRLAFDGIFDFSTKPLTAIFFLGLISSALSLAGFVFFLLHRILEFKIFGHSPADVPGMTSIVLAIFFIGGVQLLAIGVLGEYVGRVYAEVKRRPGFVVKSVTTGGAHEGTDDGAC
jgi:glycosyltransferase involved in cell wall biosynthesis